MPTTTEVVIVPMPANTNIGDPADEAAQILKDVCDVLSEQSGWQQIHFGTQIEHPDTLQMFIDWDSIEKHKEFEASAKYGPFLQRFSGVIAGPPTIYHADFLPADALARATAAPVTEVVALNFAGEAGVPSGTMEALLKFRQSIIDANVPGFVDAAGGPTYEEIEIDGTKGKAVIMAIGWESVEAHTKYRETSVFTENAHLLRENVQKSHLNHVALLKYQKS